MMKLKDLMLEIEKLPLDVQADLMVGLTRKVADRAAAILPPGPVRHAQVAPGVVAELRRVLKINYGQVEDEPVALEMGVE